MYRFHPSSETYDVRVYLLKYLLTYLLNYSDTHIYSISFVHPPCVPCPYRRGEVSPEGRVSKRRYYFWYWDHLKLQKERLKNWRFSFNLKSNYGTQSETPFMFSFWSVRKDNHRLNRVINYGYNSISWRVILKSNLPIKRENGRPSLKSRKLVVKG